MTQLKRITVFCGSGSGTDEIYTRQAQHLGKILAEQNIGLVYGGAMIGLMGTVADAVLNAGGKAIGIIPVFLQKKEVVHEHLTELIVVRNMHERKAKMNEYCDGVIALPGGFGTMEELFEMLTWAQLGLHNKPIGLLNVNGFYNDLIHLIQTMTEKGFLKELNKQMLLVSTDITDLLHQMRNYAPPQVEKWLSEETS